MGVIVQIYKKIKSNGLFLNKILLLLPVIICTSLTNLYEESALKLSASRFAKKQKDETFGLLNNIEMNNVKEGALLIYGCWGIFFLIHALIAT